MRKILHRCVTVAQEMAFHPTMSIYRLLTDSWKNTHDNLTERAQYMEVCTPIFRRHLSNIAGHLQSPMGASMHMLRSDKWYNLSNSESNCVLCELITCILWQSIIYGFPLNRMTAPNVKDLTVVLLINRQAQAWNLNVFKQVTWPDTEIALFMFWMRETYRDSCCNSTLCVFYVWVSMHHKSIL